MHSQVNWFPWVYCGNITLDMDRDDSTFGCVHFECLDVFVFTKIAPQDGSITGITVPPLRHRGAYLRSVLRKAENCVVHRTSILMHWYKQCSGTTLPSPSLVFNASNIRKAHKIANQIMCKVLLSCGTWPNHLYLYAQ